MEFSLDYLRHRLSPHIAIDSGSSMTRIQFCPARGKIIEEPTIIVLDQKRKKTLAYGKDAEQLVGKVASDVSVIRPVVRGAIVDDLAMEKFFRRLFERVLGKYFLFKPSVIVSIPSGSVPVAREIWEETMYALGVREIFLVDQALAAAIGAEVPVARGSGNIVVHLGSDISEIVLISLGSVVQSRTGRFGGRDIDREIQRVIRQKQNVHIGLSTAEYLKKELGNFLTVENGKSIRVSGQHIRQARPVEIEVSHSLVLQATQKYALKLHRLISEMLEDTPAELAVDVIDKGFLLTGGSARLHGLDSYLTQVLDVPVSTAEEPEMCVIKGMQIIFQHLSEYKQSVLGK